LCRRCPDPDARRGSFQRFPVDYHVEVDIKGIRHYWILDVTEPVSLLACHLAGSFGYADSGAVTGTFEAAEPFPVRLELDALI
jgi:hypothetical protein